MCGRYDNLIAREAYRRRITELRGDLLQSGKLNDTLIDAFLAQCADPNWWTQTIAFTAVYARTRELLKR